MATSDRTIEQVREILGKLDRSISEARQRRLGETPAPVPEPPRPEHDASSNGRTEAPANGDGNGSVIGHSTGPRAGSSPFGRAKPLNKPTDRPSSLGRWSQ